MTEMDSLDVGDLFLADPQEITKGQVKAKTTGWPDVETISVTHNEDGALTDTFIAEVTKVSNGVVRAEKAAPEGPRMILPGDELAVTVDTIDSDETLVADVSAATNIDYVYPLDNRNPGASLQVQVIQTSDTAAYADVLSVLKPGVNVGDQVDIKVERGTSIAEFDSRNLASFDCRLNQKPTAGGPGIARIIGYSTEGIECKLADTANQLQVGDRYQMAVNRGKPEASPRWDDAVGVQSVALEDSADASTTAIVELTGVRESVTGRIVGYQNVPEIGSTHRVSLERGQDTVVLEGIPIYLDFESEISGEGTIEITGGEVPRSGQISEYHNLPEAGTKTTLALDREQDFVMLDGVPIDLEEPSQISGDVTIEIVGGGLPSEGRITEYPEIPNSGEIIDCRVERGASQAILQGVPIQFSPSSRVGGLDIRLKILDENPPVEAKLIGYPSLEQGDIVRAEVDDDNLGIAHALKGEYKLNLVNKAEKAAKVRVKLVSVTPKKIIGEIDGYLSIGSSGQSIDRNLKGNSPFNSGKAKNDEITGKKL